MCIGRGPAWEADDHGFKSNEIIARRQSDKAVELWEDSKATAIKGNPASFYQLVPLALLCQPVNSWMLHVSGSGRY